MSNNSIKNTKTVLKKRNWGFVLYPDSMPSNWKEILIQTGLPCAISPLHQYDSNSDGEIKKAHHHIIVCYSGPTSFNVVKTLTDKLNAPIPIPLESVKGAYRYFSHLDNPEKYQYDPKDIQHLNGFDPLDLCGYTQSEIDTFKKNIVKIIRDNDIIEYSILINYLLDNDLSDLFYTASCNTIFFNSYIKSRRFALEQPKNDKEEEIPF